MSGTDETLLETDREGCYVPCRCWNSQDCEVFPIHMSATKDVFYTTITTTFSYVLTCTDIVHGSYKSISHRGVSYCEHVGSRQRTKWSKTNLLTTWSRVPLEKLRVCSASQKIPCILWNLQVHHHVHKSTPPVPIYIYIYMYRERGGGGVEPNPQPHTLLPKVPS
jgi:hypothetical protein